MVTEARPDTPDHVSAGGDAGAAATRRGLETRRRIVDAALDLVKDRGYEKATMRAIAARAGVSVGNAYYYFPSKAHLVQAFYAETRRDLVRATEPILERERTLEGRLRGVLWAWFRLIDPYHRVAGTLLAAASEPESPLNPFSPEAEPARAEAIALFRELVEGASSHVPDELRPELPALLWSAHMGVILYWIHDPSPGRQRTRILIDRAPGLLVRIIAMARLPGMGDLRRQVGELAAVLMGEA